MTRRIFLSIVVIVACFLFLAFIFRMENPTKGIVQLVGTPVTAHCEKMLGC